MERRAAAVHGGAAVRAPWPQEMPEGTGWHDVDIDDLFGGPARGHDEIAGEMRHELGTGAPRVRRRPPDGPDVSGLADLLREKGGLL